MNSNSMKLSMWQAIPLFALAFSLGLGMFKATLLIILANIFIFRSQIVPILGSIKLGGWIFIALVSSFLLLYWMEYVPYQPERFIIEAHYFKMLFILSACVMVMPYCTNDLEDSIRLIWYLGLGALVWAVGTVIATVVLSDPPYYGKIVDLRSLARGVLHFGNTPGIASLLVFFPVISLAVFALLKPRKDVWLWIFSLIALAVSIVCAILIQQRSFFLIVLIVQPLIVGVFAFLLGKNKTGLIFLSVLTGCILFFLVDMQSNYGLLARKLDQNLFTDARVQMFKYWLGQISIHPLIRSIVGPPPLDVYPYFHNFFADVHRLSGFWAFFVSIALIGYIFTRLIVLTNKNKKLGLYLISLAAPIFLIMMSSVVPEGEKQPFLVFLLIGAVAEKVLASNCVDA